MCMCGGRVCVKTWPTQFFPGEGITDNVIERQIDRETQGQLEGNFEGETNLSLRKGKPSEYNEYTGLLSVK